MLSIEYMVKGVRIRATDALHVQHSPLLPTCSGLVLFILSIALKISSTASSVESVLSKSWHDLYCYWNGSGS